MMLLGLMALVTVVMHVVSAQNRGSATVRQEGERSEIVTARTTAFLSCKSGDMVVSVNFTSPFRGLMYAYKSRNTPCRVFGTGGTYYELRIPLKGCGTWQESPRVFVNNVTIRFHPALELEEDETKTLVCRYPPPLTPSPSEGIHVVQPVSPPPEGTTRVRKARLSEVEILIIICLLLFLSLLTLGIGIAYFCLKRRNIHLVRRKPMSSAPASQLTKLSASTPQQSSLLTGAILSHTVKIPRAVPYSASLRTQTVSDQLYDRGHQSSSPEISRDSLELTPSTSTTSTESTDVTGNLLRLDKSHTGVSLTIPKAVLRKTETERRTFNAIHQRSSSTPSTESWQTGELEDQIVTTVLEPEYSDNGNHAAYRNSAGHQMPVYAQVHKKKQKVKISEESIEQVSAEETGKPGAGRREELVFDKKLSTRRSGETKITTITTRKVIDREPQTGRNGAPTSPLYTAEVMGSQQSQRSSLEDDDFAEALPQDDDRETALKGFADEKSISIKDISDVFVTTTTKTECTEIRTTVSRDVIEEHVKGNEGPVGGQSPEDIEQPDEDTKDHSASKPSLVSKQKDELSDESDTQPVHLLPHGDAPETGSQGTSTQELPPSAAHEPTAETAVSQKQRWNVVIRQRVPPPMTKSSGTDESSDDSPAKSAPTRTSPVHFDVRIRTLPPPKAFREETAERRESTELVDVPQLQMPHSIEKLRGIMAQLETFSSEMSSRASAGADENKESSSTEVAAYPQKAVTWSDDNNPVVSTYSPEPDDTPGSSGTFRSETSLRERSSSEVLEKAPTLFTRSSMEHPDLERSTSEILTSPENYKQTRDVPVLQSYSPEFLANIPVVSQGGFFHRPAAEDPVTDVKTGKDDRPKLEIWKV